MGYVKYEMKIIQIVWNCYIVCTVSFCISAFHILTYSYVPTSCPLTSLMLQKKKPVWKKFWSHKIHRNLTNTDNYWTFDLLKDFSILMQSFVVFSTLSEFFVIHFTLCSMHYFKCTEFQLLMQMLCHVQGSPYRLVFKPLTLF